MSVCVNWACRSRRQCGQSRATLCSVGRQRSFAVSRCLAFFRITGNITREPNDAIHSSLDGYTPPYTVVGNTPLSTLRGLQK